MAGINVNILAFDTAFSTCSVGLLHHGQVSVIDRFAPMQQSKIILPMIADLLSRSALRMESLDAIAYGCGPGSFTGVRIAKSVAQGIGFALQKPILPISSMAILAQTAWMEKGWDKVAVCVDARMGQIHWGEYSVHNSSRVLLCGAEHTCSPSELQLIDPLYSRTEGWYGVGDGWATYQPCLFEFTGIEAASIETVYEPHASAIIVLAEAAMGEYRCRA